MSEELTPPLKQVYDYLKTQPCHWLSTREVAEALGISYSSAYYRLKRLAALDYIAEHLAWIVKPRIRRRWFHYIPPFYKSHVIISMDYAEEHLFETHIIFPHLKKEITENDEETLIYLSYHLILDYGVPESLLKSRKTTWNLGEVQTKPVNKFNEKTEASIFDVKTSGSPVRTSYKIMWKYEKGWVETTLDGQRIEHPPKITYTSFESIGKIGREALKEKWRKQAEEEAIQ